MTKDERIIIPLLDVSVLDQVTLLLRAVEQCHHNAGWDGAPTSIYRIGQEQPSGWDVHFHALDVGEVEDELRQTADEPHDTAVREASFTAPPIAHLLVAEGWTQHFDSAAARAAATRSPADSPDGVESRWAVAVTDNDVVVIYRARHHAPVLVPQDYDFGPFVSYLTTIHQAAAQCWPRPLTME